MQKCKVLWAGGPANSKRIVWAIIRSPMAVGNGCTALIHKHAVWCTYCLSRSWGGVSEHFKRIAWTVTHGCAYGCANGCASGPFATGMLCAPLDAPERLKEHVRPTPDAEPARMTRAASITLRRSAFGVFRTSLGYTVKDWRFPLPSAWLPVLSIPVPDQ